MDYAKISQGYLCASYAQIAQKFGDIKQIDDLDGWEVEIEGLEIQIITFDCETPKLQHSFTIYSHHVGSLELLAAIFGQENISTHQPQAIPQEAA